MRRRRARPPARGRRRSPSGRREQELIRGSRPWPPPAAAALLDDYLSPEDLGIREGLTDLVVGATRPRSKAPAASIPVDSTTPTKKEREKIRPSICLIANSPLLPSPIPLTTAPRARRSRRPDSPPGSVPRRRLCPLRPAPARRHCAQPGDRIRPVRTRQSAPGSWRCAAAAGQQPAASRPARFKGGPPCFKILDPPLVRRLV